MFNMEKKEEKQKNMDNQRKEERIENCGVNRREERNIIMNANIVDNIAQILYSCNFTYELRV